MLNPSALNIIFLKQFTKELIKNSAPWGQQAIVAEKLAEVEKREAIPQKIIHPPILSTETLIPSVKIENRLIPAIPFITPRQHPAGQFPGTQNKLNMPVQQEKIQLQFVQNPEEIDLGKMNSVIKDPAVTIIECPGPDKLLTVKRAGQMNITNIKLNEFEISEIIKKFSDKTRIPIIGGAFKAAVGNLIITAVISEFIGSRFIITKLTPYSLIEQSK